MKTLFTLLFVTLLSVCYDASLANADNARAKAAAETVGISPLWMYNKDTHTIRERTAEVQAVLDRKQKLNDELLELCHSMQAAYNRESDVVGCEM